MGNLKSYAMYFASYLVDRFNGNEIRNIILFGSVARGNNDKESDVDIFIELEKNKKSIENKIIDILDKFYKSREAMVFKARGVNNKINLKIGEFSSWKELESSIASDGIYLYGKYESRTISDKEYHSIIIFWDSIEKNRGAFLNKIYGFNVKGKHYNGLIDKYKGRKLGKSCVMFNIKYKDDVFKILKEYRVNAKIIEVFL